MVSGPTRTDNTTEVIHVRRNPHSANDIPVVCITVPLAAAPETIAMGFPRFFDVPISQCPTSPMRSAGVSRDARSTLDELHNLNTPHPRRRQRIRHLEISERTHPPPRIRNLRPSTLFNELRNGPCTRPEPCLAGSAITHGIGCARGGGPPGGRPRYTLTCRWNSVSSRRG